MRLADIEFLDHGDTMVVRVTGEIDLSNSQLVTAGIGEATPNEALALVLDLSRLEYLDSAGIQLIYTLREQLLARGQSLTLVLSPECPAHVALRFAGVSDLVPVRETVEAALEAAAASS